MVCLLATFLASAAFIPNAWLSASIHKTGFFAFFGFSNLVLATNSGNYFSPLAEFNPFTHTWSLAIEEQFYLIFPLIFIVWLRGLKRAAMAIFAIALLASLVYAAILVTQAQAQAFYMIWTRFWELGSGILLFQLLHYFGHAFDVPSPNRAWLSTLGNLGLILVAIGLVYAKPEFAPVPACLAAVIGTVLLLGCLHGRQGGAANFLLTRRPLVFTGKISYSLYLWHWPIFVFLRWTVGLEAYPWQFLAILLTGLCAVSSYYLIEQPPRRMARNVNQLVLIACGLSAMGVAYVLATAIVAKQDSISLSVVTKIKTYGIRKDPGPCPAMAVL